MTKVGFKMSGKGLRITGGESGLSVMDWAGKLGDQEFQS
jgi:hypothetical protein